MVSRLLAGLLLLLYPILVLAQEVEISVDRNEIARGDTVELTIRVYQQRQNAPLDLSPLDDDFDILASRTSSQIRSINNQVESWIDYIITLFPTREGEIEIPPLTIAGTITEPITIAVVDRGPNSNQGNNELFLETEVNKEAVYVQEQLLFTIRLFYTISGIRNPQFTELNMPDTVIQLIGSPNQYERLIDGVRYGVYEMRYVIFPQRSGPLEIPDILFRGEVTDGSSNFVFRNLNTQRVTAYIEGKTVNVLERPAAAQNLNFWLPARNVTVEESWDRDISTLQIGETATRTVRLVAEGLDGAMLPPFSPTSIDGVNLYSEPSDIQRSFVEGRIVGTRVESTSMVPTRAGTIEIPELSIPWWDIGSNELRFAIVPPSNLNVTTIAGDVPAEQSVANSGAPLSNDPAAPVLDQSMIDEQNEATLINVPVVWFNIFIIAAVLFVLGSIYVLVIRSFNIDPAALIRAFVNRQLEKRQPENNEGVAFDALQTALGSGNARKIRSTLITWGSHYYAPEKVLSMDDIIRLADYPDLETFCLKVQAALFNTGDGKVEDTGAVQQILSDMRNSKRKARRQIRRTQAYALPPLYRT